MIKRRYAEGGTIDGERTALEAIREEG